MKKKILLLGSTGSIGTSACNCIRRFPDYFELVGIAANTNVDRLIAQTHEFKPRALCIGSLQAAHQIRTSIPDSMPVYEGKDGLVHMVENLDFDILINALVGAVGFKPTVVALQKNKRVALANKESLVIGGEVITKLLDNGCGSLVPIDSEHSAILQCLNGENCRSIERITITASGGPFRETPFNAFQNITPAQALKHPTWSMGDKITIDSATLINKGFEVIEAHYIFRIPYEKLQVLIHPQSIVHSMVTFHDGAVMAQCGIPDMELPIQYALTYPERFPILGKRLHMDLIGSLTFTPPDFNRFPCLKLCLDAGKQGGTLLTVLNAANEIVVKQFLNHTISFTQIAPILQDALDNHVNQKADSVESIEAIDTSTRERILNKIT